MKKTVFRILTAVAMIPCLLASAFAAENDTMPYTDLVEDAWYYEAVSDLYEENVMVGISADLYAPGAVADMGNLIMGLYMMATDAEERDAEAALAWAVSNGIIPSDADLSAAVTREGAAVILQNFIYNCGVNMPATLNIPMEFADQDKITEDAVNAVMFMQNVRLLLGYEDNTFRPEKNMTRAEVATVLYRMNEYCTVMPLIVVIPGNVSTGYTWQPAYDEEMVWIQELPYITAENGLLGAEGSFRFAVYGLTEGNTQITFTSERVWEEETVVDEMIVNISVDANGKVTQLSR